MGRASMSSRKTDDLKLHCRHESNSSETVDCALVGQSIRCLGTFVFSDASFSRSDASSAKFTQEFGKPLR
jgi:hypothetical protein